MASVRLLLLVCLSSVFYQQASAIFGIKVPDFLTKGVANLGIAVADIAGNKEAAIRAGCQTVGYYNTMKAQNAGSGIGAVWGTTFGALGAIFAGEKSKQELCHENGYYNDPDDPSQANSGGGTAHIPPGGTTIVHEAGQVEHLCQDYDGGPIYSCPEMGR